MRFSINLKLAILSADRIRFYAALEVTTFYYSGYEAYIFESVYTFALVSGERCSNVKNVTS